MGFQSRLIAILYKTPFVKACFVFSENTKTIQKGVVRAGHCRREVWILRGISFYIAVLFIYVLKKA